MRFFVLVWLLVLALAAQARPGGDSNYNNASSATPAYQGPGDIVAFTGWYSCARSYSAAYAASGTGKACKLRRASDSTICDFDINTAGNLGGSDSGCSLGGGLTPAAFATQDATCTGTILSTTLTCSAASSTPHVGSSLTGAGITQPSWITACGTFTSGAGTCTLNQAQTVGVAETITMTYGLFVTEAYDQSGNAHHLVQPSFTADQPNFIPGCLGTNPCVTSNVAIQALPTASTFTPATGVVSLEGVAMRDNVAHTGPLITENAAAGNRFQTANSANTWTLAGGSSGTFNLTVSNSVAHAFNAVINGASSVVNVDGTETTGTATGSTTAGNIIGFTGAALQNTTYGELGVIDNVANSGTVRTNLCHNAFVYWGTATSC